MNPYDLMRSYEAGLCLQIWFVEVGVIESALAGNLICETEVEQIPYNLPSSLLKPQLDLNLIKPFFTAEAWATVQSVLEDRNSHGCVVNVKETQ